MRPRLAEHLAAEARAVERDRRRPPVGIEGGVTGGGGLVLSTLGSDSGTGVASVAGSLALPTGGTWLVMVEVQISSYSSSVAAPGSWGTTATGGGVSTRTRALAPGGTTQDATSILLTPTSAYSSTITVAADLIDSGDSVSLIAGAVGYRLGS